MNFSRFFIDRPIFAGVLSTLIFVAGLLSLPALPISEYPEVALGVSIDGMRVVTSGLHPGERIVVKGLQRVRPGAVVAPQEVAMDSVSAAQTAIEVAQR